MGEKDVGLPDPLRLPGDWSHWDGAPGAFGDQRGAWSCTEPEGEGPRGKKDPESRKLLQVRLWEGMDIQEVGGGVPAHSPQGARGSRRGRDPALQPSHGQLWRLRSPKEPFSRPSPHPQPPALPAHSGP